MRSRLWEPVITWNLGLAQHQPREGGANLSSLALAPLQPFCHPEHQEHCVARIISLVSCEAERATSAVWGGRLGVRHSWDYDLTTVLLR